ncbi:CBS domain-containing protein [Allopusillimonas soli]|uniref:Magnesium and cobalt efflux protein CorC n=1 Tax=Allopusillimonas soli TaxID=659016 RepID=A0A853FFJ4_9BURK|nr:transporter associated domain-containing protein [Allopusillimonas soli]NYT38843.1 CBS domain-containing protein [Allopusillimonas soli]TEA70185.1 CBS domain-containing protein [Allopusillimonas soli]
MSDPSSPDAEQRPAKNSKSLFQRLTSFMRPTEPADREDIKAVLEAAHDRKVLDGEAYAMISGALDVAEQTVADIMVPRSKMDMLDISKPLSEILPEIIETGHSRFPIYEDDRDNIVGILLAKDLLLSVSNPSIDLRPLVRPAVFIPETKRLNVLLHEFRISRNHLAIVVDEHGGISGLVSMEDVLEQIVGDIEDEYDEDDEKTIFQTGTNSWRAMGITEIENFNVHFGTHLPHEDYDTIGGWLAAELGRIPRRGDSINYEGLNITVVGADARRALWLHIQHHAAKPPAPADAA